VLGKEFIQIHGHGEMGRYVLISVTDTGIGMNEEIKKKVFGPFITTKEVGKGTGLGLSTAYSIIKQHKGYIDIESQPNKGTTFHIYLPMVEAEAEDVKPARLKLEGGTETIFLANDNPEVRNFT
jgi:signal transduction histidine kinase